MSNVFFSNALFFDFLVSSNKSLPVLLVLDEIHTDIHADIHTDMAFCNIYHQGSSFCQTLFKNSNCSFFEEKIVQRFRGWIKLGLFNC